MPTKSPEFQGFFQLGHQLGQIHWGDGLTDLTGPTEGLQVQPDHVSRTYDPTVLTVVLTVLTGTAYDKRTQRRVRRLNAVQENNLSNHDEPNGAGLLVAR